MEDEIQQIKNEIREIKENHLVHIEKDLIEIKVNYAVLGADLVWLKKFLFIVTSASIGSLIAGLFNLL